MKKITQIEFNRNGISGNSFYSVKFKDKWQGKETNFIAIIDCKMLEKHNETMVYIISPKNLSLNWRGDFYADWLISKIKNFE